MAPIIEELRCRSWAKVSILSTGQHRHILDQALRLFGLVVDRDLELMQRNQQLSELTARLMVGVDNAISEMRPDIVLAQGDTTSVLVTALASFYRKVPFGHVEAGLRTGIADNPFPEEMNRTLCASLARWHFAPTQKAADNLRREGVPESRIHITGNTVIDALLRTASRVNKCPYPLNRTNRLILITAHRRENFGAPLREAMFAIKALAEENQDIECLYPVHPNPNVRSMAQEILGATPRVHLVEPMEYDQFIAAMKASTIILTDSGGVQEEAPSLGVPVLVMRDETERPEAVEAGVAKLVGTRQADIRAGVNELLRDATAHTKMSKRVSPYGDGQASSRIVELLKNALIEKA